MALPGYNGDSPVDSHDVLLRSVGATLPLPKHVPDEFSVATKPWLFEVRVSKKQRAACLGTTAPST